MKFNMKLVWERDPRLHPDMKDRGATRFFDYDIREAAKSPCCRCPKAQTCREECEDFLSYVG